MFDAKIARQMGGHYVSNARGIGNSGPRRKQNIAVAKLLRRETGHRLNGTGDARVDGIFIEPAFPFALRRHYDQ